jgi:hypothetical protein
MEVRPLHQIDRSLSAVIMLHDYFGDTQTIFLPRTTVSNFLSLARALFLSFTAFEPLK